MIVLALITLSFGQGGLAFYGLLQADFHHYACISSSAAYSKIYEASKDNRIGFQNSTGDLSDCIEECGAKHFTYLLFDIDNPRSCYCVGDRTNKEPSLAFQPSAITSLASKDGVCQRSLNLQCLVANDFNWCSLLDEGLGRDQFFNNSQTSDQMYRNFFPKCVTETDLSIITAPHELDTRDPWECQKWCVGHQYLVMQEKMCWCLDEDGVEEQGYLEMSQECKMCNNSDQFSPYTCGNTDKSLFSVYCNDYQDRCSLFNPGQVEKTIVSNSQDAMAYFGCTSRPLTSYHGARPKLKKSPADCLDDCSYEGGAYIHPDPFSFKQRVWCYCKQPVKISITEMSYNCELSWGRGMPGPVGSSGSVFSSDKKVTIPTEGWALFTTVDKCQDMADVDNFFKVQCSTELQMFRN